MQQEKLKRSGLTSVPKERQEKVKRSPPPPPSNPNLDSKINLLEAKIIELEKTILDLTFKNESLMKEKDDLSWQEGDKLKIYKATIATLENDKNQISEMLKEKETEIKKLKKKTVEAPEKPKKENKEKEENKEKNRKLLIEAENQLVNKLEEILGLCQGL